ncbi:MAG: T9SS type A sorting domain-containing protein [Lentimicrobiaceae bacterium]|nr:T9SS type A sorting domain-containing protein [Lentimicrobiaceae bacterium]
MNVLDFFLRRRKLFIRFSVIVFFTAFILQSLTAQIPTVQDCLGAIPVCQGTYDQPNSFIGTGNFPNEIHSGQVCPNSCMDGEKNDVWYIITVKTSGLLRFSIDPYNDNDDYDWAVFNLTEHECSEIYNNAIAMQSSCNAAGGPGYHGITGISSASGGVNHCNNGGNTNKWNADLPVNAGEIYVLCVSNWSQTQSGYFLDFTSSTASIYDDVPPAIDSVAGYVGCQPSSHIYMWFSENVMCTTVQGSDFLLKGPNDEVYNVTMASGLNCLLGDQEKKFNLTFNPPIFNPGTYTLQIVSTITDLCGNNAGSIFSFPFEVTNGAPSTVEINGLSSSYCQTAQVDTITGTHNPATGNGTFSGTGITNIGNDKAIFDPSLAPVSTPIPITYSYTAPSGCSKDTTINTIVGPAPAQYNITGGGSYCEGANGVEVGLSNSESGKTYELLLNDASLTPPLTRNGNGNAISFGLQTLVGNYTVKASESGCYIMMTGSVSVSTKPLPEVFTVTGGGQVCANAGGVPIGLSGSQENGIYELLLNDNPTTPPSIANGTGSAISFGIQTSVGQYSVKGTYEGCFTMMSGTVSINYFQNPISNAGNDQTIPMGTYTQLHGSASQGLVPYTYHWEPAAMLVDPDVQEPVTVNLYASQSYQLKATDANGCYSADNMQVTVSGGVLTVNVTANRTNICLGDTTRLNALPSGGSGTYTWEWSSVPEGFTSTIQNPIITPGETTQYTCLINDGFNTMDDLITVNVHSIPVADAGIDQTIDYGTSTILEGSAQSGTPPYQFHWEPEALISDNPYIANPTTVAMTSNQQFWLTITDRWGCTSSDFMNVSVPGGAVSVAPYASPDSICKGETTTLNPGVSGGTGNYQYAWQSIPEGFTSSLPNPEVNPEISTKYIIEVYDGINYVPGAVDVYVKSLPEIELIPTGSHIYGQDSNSIITCIYDTIYLNAGNPGAEYLWSNGSDQKIIEVKTTGIAFDMQTYWVRVHDFATGCSNSDSITILFAFSECDYGIGENGGLNAVYIYPNPTNGKFILLYSGALKDADYIVSDTYGRIAIKGKLKCNGRNSCMKEIDLSFRPSGLYFITVNGDGWAKNVKVIKQ